MEHNFDHGHGKCNCPEHQHPETEEMTAKDLISEAEDIIQLVDDATGETYDFAIADDFEYKGKKYIVLLTLADEPEYVIAAEVEEDGEMMIESLSPEEEEDVYAEYMRLLTEEFAE